MTTSVSGRKDLGPRVDLIGRKFGRLTVIKLGDKLKNSKYRWFCRCECGVEKLILQSNLKQGRTKSCGCLNSEVSELRSRKYSKEDSVVRVFFKNYKRSAKVRNLNFNLSFDEFKHLGSGKCAYCKQEPPIKDVNEIINTIPYPFNGIDRIDSSLGYSIDNCVSCCSTCNSMKNSLSVSDFKKHIFKLCLNNIEEFEIYKEGI